MAFDDTIAKLSATDNEALVQRDWLNKLLDNNSELSVLVQPGEVVLRGTANSVAFGGTPRQFRTLGVGEILLGTSVVARGESDQILYSDGEWASAPITRY